MLCHCPTAAIVARSHGRQVRAETGSAAENAERLSAIAGWLVLFLLVTAIVVAWVLTVGDPPILLRPYGQFLGADWRGSGVNRWDQYWMYAET